MSRRAVTALCLLIGAAVLSFWQPASPAANASFPVAGFMDLAESTGSTATVDPVQLSGAGSDDPSGELLAWQKELYGTAGKINLSYDEVGDLTGRQVYINGLSNFVISGQPFTASDLSRLQGGASSVIAAPVMASAVGLLVMWSPTFTSHRSCAKVDSSCVATSTYTGQLNVPSTALTDILWPSIGGETCGCFTDPGIIAATQAALPQGGDAAPPTLTTPYEGGARPLILMRADPSQTNYATQQFAAAATPSEFGKILHFQPPITEYLQGEPLSGTATLDGLENELTYISSTIEQGGGASGPAASYTNRGIVLPVPPSAIPALLTASATGYVSPKGVPTAPAPPSPPRWLGVQNGDGKYVAPSPASIDAAINAGGSTPLYALSHAVGGSTPAYPLTYVNDLYAPTHGLSADKAEAMATVIRYLATAGQDAMAAQGDGQLSAALVAQALAAANQVIASNCTQPGEQVVLSNDIGRYAPVLGAMDGKTAAQRQAEMQGGAPMLHCVNGVTQTAIAPPPPAPLSTSSSGAPSGGGSQSTGGPAGVLSQVTTGGSSSASSTSSAASTPSSASASASFQGSGSRTANGRAVVIRGGKAGSHPANQVSGPVTLLDLPLPLPGLGNPGLNRLVGFLFGAGAFLLLWRYRRTLLRPLGL
jgi:hypothetical protein